MYFVCTFEARPEQREALLTTLDQLVDHSQTEPGTLQYEVLVDQENPCRVVVFERYADAAALQAHLHAPVVSSALVLFADYLIAAPTLVKSDLRKGFVRQGLSNQIG